MTGKLTSEMPRTMCTVRHGRGAVGTRGLEPKWLRSLSLSFTGLRTVRPPPRRGSKGRARECLRQCLDEETTNSIPQGFAQAAETVQEAGGPRARPRRRRATRPGGGKAHRYARGVAAGRSRQVPLRRPREQSPPGKATLRHHAGRRDPRLRGSARRRGDDAEAIIDHRERQGLEQQKLPEATTTRTSSSLRACCTSRQDRERSSDGAEHEHVASPSSGGGGRPPSRGNQDRAWSCSTAPLTSTRANPGRSKRRQSRRPCPGTRDHRPSGGS